MLIIRATQKLLNTSRLTASLHISQATEGQMLHSWYCSLLSTGFTGKLMVMYVHEPSLLSIICRGKTISGTWEEFKHRLPLLLKKFDFQSSFIESETGLADKYVVSKTNSRSMLAYINQMKIHLEIHSSRFDTYENISQDLLEESMMNYLYQTGNKSNSYRTAIEFWKDQNAIL
ncbi:hypothetical protein A3860_39670 [Niastella vici]|uniref:DUF6933 domain-containing protein n=1 Tax=Niastella vici TaxID=1703345 RepID=A0A1V9FI32_9BACT|nr:hypothetical protein [Niastella vici]OQP57937.1 hypothetical protein A3860_39670 [Niastella vici]